MKPAAQTFLRVFRVPNAFWWGHIEKDIKSNTDITLKTVYQSINNTHMSLRVYFLSA